MISGSDLSVLQFTHTYDGDKIITNSVYSCIVLNELVHANS